MRAMGGFGVPAVWLQRQELHLGLRSLRCGAARITGRHRLPAGALGSPQGPRQQNPAVAPPAPPAPCTGSSSIRAAEHGRTTTPTPTPSRLATRQPHLRLQHVLTAQLHHQGSHLLIQYRRVGLPVARVANLLPSTHHAAVGAPPERLAPLLPLL